ncbi:MAG: glycoside hydrolase family 2 protein [Fidelibacterota bacterium]|nr:MAG: glycoside hydrolase family 2 protein [Candidatus Neomarinimicrobiota bacterium]
MIRPQRSSSTRAYALLLALTVAGLTGCSCTGQESRSSTAVTTRYFTPDLDLNLQLARGEVDPVSIFGVSTTDEGLVIKPVLQDGWTWLAAKDLPHGEEMLSYFFYDGWLYTDETVYTPHRRKKYQRNVSNLISSNVFTLAFYREDGIEKELVIFIASEKEVEAELVLSQTLWGEERRVTHYLDAGEGHFLSLLNMPAEFRPLYIPADGPARSEIKLNQGWKFIRQDVPEGWRKGLDDEHWACVSIPHCWNTADVHDTRNAFDGYEEYHGYYRGPGWYRRHFMLDPVAKSKKVFLEFEGANQTAEVWINNQFIGKHVGGYTGFSFDVTDQVRFGKQNLLAVRVDNSYDYDVPPHTADFIMYGGLYRDVGLVITDRTYIEDVFVTSPELDGSAANVMVRTDIRNDTKGNKVITLVTNVVNPNGELEATARSSQDIEPGHSHQFQQVTPPIAYPELWSPDHPVLYTMYSTVLVDGRIVDEIKIPFGFRWYSFDSNKGFFLNGKSLKLQGVNKHQDYLGLGNAVPDSLLVQDIRIIKDMGANFIRLAHYPHDPAVLDACDELGLLVWAEIPLVNSVGGEVFAENTRQMMQEMIRRDRNHPSVILWGITNESAMGFANQEQVSLVMELLKELDDLSHREDPTRLTVQAHNHFKDIALADITDVLGRNRYYGWYEGTMEDFGPVMDEEHSIHPDWKILISEYGVGAKRGYHVDDPIPFDFSEEYQVDFHEHYLKAINERPWIAGGTVWNMFDFGSFVKIGNIPRVNQKGLCDMARQPKDAYYFYQSQWSDEPMVYIVSHTRTRYAGTAGESRTLRVYSNCDSVELFLNGRSLGKQQKQAVYRWQAVLVDGENHLRAVAREGNHVVEDELFVTYTTNPN